MSRHGGSSAARGWPAFQITVLDFDAPKVQQERYDRFTFLDKDGVVKKTADHTVPCTPTRTLLGHFKTFDAALRHGQHFGTVIDCHKVDREPYLRKSEYLDLQQAPLAIPIESQEITLSESLEVTAKHDESIPFDIKED